MPRHLDSSAARRDFSRLYHEVAYGGERVVIDNHGKGLVAMVPFADLARLASEEAVVERAAPERDACLLLLRRERSRLRRAGVRRVALFGSVARDQAVPESDVDLLVDIDPGRRMGLIEFVNLRDRFVKLFGRNVDLVSTRALEPERDAQILEEAVYAF